MRLPRNDTNRQIVVLLASAIAGGLYGLFRALPGDLSGIVKVSTAYVVLGLIAGYWAFVWLRPRRTHGTLIGATVGAATLMIVCSLLPEQFVSNRLFTIIDGAFVGVFIGALFGTAPRGAFIGGGIGAVAMVLWVTICFWLIGSHSFDLLVSAYAAFVGLFLGTWIGASRELNGHSKVTTPHP